MNNNLTHPQDNINNVLAPEKTKNKYCSDISFYCRNDTIEKAKTYIESLTKLEAAILSYLFSFHGKEFISLKHATVADNVGCSEITVKRATAKFKRDGWVDSQQAVSVYSVNDYRLMAPLQLLSYVQMTSIEQSINAKRKPNKHNLFK
jgi:DNA-binding MurR/RpiR family transcriptional regulator